MNIVSGFWAKCKTWRIDATYRQVRIRRLLLQSMMGKAVIRRKKMQTLLHHILARSKKLLNVCKFITLLLLLPRADNATLKYTRFCRHLERNTGWFICVWNTYSEEHFNKTFEFHVENFSLS